jgi:hypothetical protein
MRRQYRACDTVRWKEFPLDSRRPFLAPKAALALMQTVRRWLCTSGVTEYHRLVHDPVVQEIQP